ncbi:hypothetical protein [Streptomyces sp. NPDC058751]|uniref:hypothetical protein n=1 Tax=Streptomyces sp. NPDC058751 TaxID=3346623 RepID=UPI003693090F
MTDVSTPGADPTDQAGETEMRYTFSVGAKPVLLSTLTAATTAVSFDALQAGTCLRAGAATWAVSNWVHDEAWTWINAAYLKTFMERHMLSSERNTSNAFTDDIVFYDWKTTGKSTMPRSSARSATGRST